MPAMGVATETYEKMEALLVEAWENFVEGGPEPIGWLLSGELYRQLDYPGERYEHFKTCERAIFQGRTPKELYQLPVTLEVGAHHAWRLRFAGR